MEKIIVVGFVLLILGAFVAAIAGIVWFLWNVLAGYFAFKAITYLVAVVITIALLVLSALFKSSTKKD